MYSALSLENLAKSLHAEKERRFIQEHSAYSIDQAQAKRLRTPWWQKVASLRRITTHQLVVTFVIRPLRLVGQ